MSQRHSERMQPPSLLPTQWLDPRPEDVAADRPIPFSVNIPIAELPGRVHELLPRNHEVLVVRCDESAAAVAWLESAGRKARSGAHAYAEYCESMAPTPPRPPTRLWRPTEFLACVAPWLGAGRALELACGAGRDAVFLASLGWSVVAVDHLTDALERGRDLARRYLPPEFQSRIEWRRADIESPDFDPGERFELITGFRFLHRPLFERVREWLVPGGVLLWETFTETHRSRYGKPASDAHVLAAGELRRLSGALDVIHSSEAERGAAHTARLFARRARD